jgi:hypothetical protein
MPTTHVVVELTETAYNKLLSDRHLFPTYWFAVVEYKDGTKWFRFTEPYNVKVSDFFDTTKENPILSIFMS